MASIRPEPYLSASMPVKGWVAPQRTFWIASDRAKTSRLQVRSEEIGSRNRPKLARTPNEMMPIRQPQVMTTATGNCHFALPD